MRNRILSMLYGLLLSILVVNLACAADGAALYQQKICIACHGNQGKQPISPNFPILAGQNKGYLLQQFKDIQSGARNNGATSQMKGIAQNVSSDEIETITDYLSGL